MRALASALNVLGDVKTSEGLKTTLTQLNRIPKIMEALDSAGLEKFANQMKEVASAMKPLADEMDKIARGFDKFPAKIKSTISAIDKMSTTSKRSSNTFGLFNSSFAKFGLFYLSFDKVVDVLSDALNESNAYVENLNLFTVSMGEYAEEAKRYAETVQDALGIDFSEWIRNQAMFMRVGNGFGIVSDKAAIMSKNLTQLGYDLSSYYNVTVEEAMLKLQSGFSGEPEPLRRWGYAIEQATLQQIAYNNGITQSIDTMTQAQKAMLRYVAIMDQSKDAMGDLSRTINKNVA